MPANVRDNFDPWQKKVTLEVNSKGVRARWEEFKDSPETFYMCEHCRFVSANRDYFEVDHIVSCEQGGNADRETLERISALQVELNKPLDKQHIGLIASANLNDQVLCGGCNQGKKSKLLRPDEIPEGCGFAYRRRDEDKNPDHAYDPPQTTGPVLPRYHKQLLQRKSRTV